MSRVTPCQLILRCSWPDARKSCQDGGERDSCACAAEATVQLEVVSVHKCPERGRARQARHPSPNITHLAQPVALWHSM